MKIKEIVNKRTIILASIGAVLVGGASVFAAQSNQQVANVSEPPKASEPAPKKEIEIKEVEEVAVVEQEEIVESPTIQVTQQPEPQVQEAPVEAPVTYKWEAEMAAAGIAESDYGYVNDLTLDDNGWKLIARAGAWKEALRIHDQCNGQLVLCIQMADQYVKKHHGTWTQANYLWHRAGNF